MSDNINKMKSLYLPIDTETIQPGTQQPFKFYFKASDGNMVPCNIGGEASNGEVSDRIQEVNITEKLYIQKKDKTNYYLYVEENLENILFNPRIDTAVKAKTAYNTIMNVAESLFKGPKAKTIQRYKKIIFTTTEFIFEDDEALQKMISLTTFDFSIYNHNVNVGIFGIGLAKELLGSDKEHDFHEMAAGFFLHDIGLSTVPGDILNKKGLLSPVEWKFIKKHPAEGCRILGQFGALTTEAKIIVYQHHERHNGKGYPEGLKGSDIHIYGKICAISDVFDGLTSYRPYKNEYSSFNALKILKNEMSRDFDPEIFSTFVQLFRD